MNSQFTHSDHVVYKVSECFTSCSFWLWGKRVFPSAQASYRIPSTFSLKALCDGDPETRQAAVAAIAKADADRVVSDCSGEVGFRAQRGALIKKNRGTLPMIVLVII